jgi:phospholipase C
VTLKAPGLALLAALAGAGCDVLGISNDDATGAAGSSIAGSGAAGSGAAGSGAAGSGAAGSGGQAGSAGACGDVSADDANCGSCGNACPAAQHCVAASCVASKIEHVVLIVQENHTFDSYFGRYCQAPAGSAPTCTSGPPCCEAAPDLEPRGVAPIKLDDASNFATDRDHEAACEMQQIDDGRMDGFVTGSSGSGPCLGPDCASPNNWALADGATLGAYWSLADGNALADRYFQPTVGSTSSNNMYFASAHFEFADNDVFPDTIGAGCVDQTGICLSAATKSFAGETTIADLLLAAEKTFTVYADGFAEAKAAAPGCPDPPSTCPYAPALTCDLSLHPIACHGCIYDPSDIPFAYYAQLGDRYTKDYTDLALDLAGGRLPSFAFVKAREFRNEHPNLSTISDGVAFVSATLQSIASSPYAATTLVLLTWDEGGGFFDHVPPPAGIDVDDQGRTVPYGTRVPLLAIGPFARKGAVSHVQMEHSSLVRFLEYNFVGPTGQLGANDAKVANIGGLLDPATTGIVVPER